MGKVRYESGLSTGYRHLASANANSPLFNGDEDMRTNKPRHQNVLLEHEDGVMEVFFVAQRSGDEVLLRPVGSVPQSGTIRATNRRTLTEALRLLKWSEDHSEVFEGRVVIDSL